MEHADRERVAYLDVLRVVAVAAVVAVHTANSVLHESTFNGAAWWLGNIASSALRWSVPVFLMISGSLLLDVSRRMAFSARMVRIAIPTAFWSCVYLTIEHFDGGLTPKLLLWKIAHGQVYYHLWYLFMLLGMYAVLLPLRKLCVACDRRELFATLLVMFVLESAYYIDASRATLETNAVAQEIFALQFVPYVPYVLLGHYLGKYEITVCRAKTCWLFLVIFVAVISAAQWYFSQLTGSFLASTIAHSNHSPLILGSAVVIYLRAKAVAPAGAKEGLLRLCRAVAPVSLGIYAIHPLVLKYLRSLMGEPGLLSAYGLAIVPVSMVVFVVSLMASLAMSRIPLLRKCVI